MSETTISRILRVDFADDQSDACITFAMSDGSTFSILATAAAIGDCAAKLTQAYFTRQTQTAPKGGLQQLPSARVVASAVVLPLDDDTVQVGLKEISGPMLACLMTPDVAAALGASLVEKAIEAGTRPATARN